MTMASLAVTLATLQPAHNFSETARVRLSSGVSVEYLDRPAAIVEGDVDATTASYRPPLLLLHGWPDSVRTFDLLIPHLNPRLRVIRVGLRGFGGSDGAKGMPPIPSDAGGFTIEQMAADVRAFIDALGLRMVYLGGVSMGSFVAHAVAAHWPRVVSKLVLVASCDVAADSVKFYAAARALAMERPEWVKGSTELTPAFVSSFQASVHGNGSSIVPASFLSSTIVPQSLLAPLTVWRASLTSLLQDNHTAILTTQLAAPTLLISGEQDAIFPPDVCGARLRAAIPTVTSHVILPGVGHTPSWEAPAALGKAISTFALSEDASSSAVGTVQPRKWELFLDASRSCWLGEESTADKAQHHFTAGLRLAIGFDFLRATEAFRQCALASPGCAMCHWGVAWTLGPSLNHPAQASGMAQAYRAMFRAKQLHAAAVRDTPAVSSNNASAVAGLLISAMAARYSIPAPNASELMGLSRAYADAMEDAAAAAPNDAMVQFLAADAQLNLGPWDYWADPPVGTTFKPHGLKASIFLQRALALEPKHAGALHLRLHLLEASDTRVAEAVEAADALRSLWLDAPHLLHMPSHVDMRTGRYAKCATANAAAAALPLVAQPYPEHNLESLAWCARHTFDRRAAEDASSRLAERARVGMLVSSTSADMNPYERYLVAPTLTALYFGDWLAAAASVPQEPPARLAYSRAVWWYAQGMAAAHSPLAEVESGATAYRYLMSLQSVANDVSQRDYDPRLIFLVAIYVHRLRADIALVAASSQPDGVAVAVEEAKRAVEVQDAMGYDEPRAWYESGRPALALALAAQAAATRPGGVASVEQARRPAQKWQLGPPTISSLPADALAPALAVLREDLRRIPANPQALHVCARLGMPGCLTDAESDPVAAIKHAVPIPTANSSTPSGALTATSRVVEGAPVDSDQWRLIPGVEAGSTPTLVMCAAMMFVLLMLLAMAAAIRRKRVADKASALNLV